MISKVNGCGLLPKTCKIQYIMAIYYVNLFLVFKK
jgi:hypothetical protein